MAAKIQSQWILGTQTKWLQCEMLGNSKHGVALALRAVFWTMWASTSRVWAKSEWLGSELNCMILQWGQRL